MALEFTADGITVDTFDDIYNRLADGLKAIYGADIDLSQETPDGQRVGILAKEILDGQSFGALLYSQLDIDFSFGTFQDVIGKIAGVFRSPAQRSQADIDLQADRDFTLLANYTIQDDNGQRWLTDSDNAISSGSNTITVFAETFGDIQATAGTIVTPVTITLGVISVTNPLDAIVGVDEESDEDLRIKRNKSLENPAYSTLGAILAKMGALEGVTDFAGYENNTAITDAIGVDGHSIWVIVEGGEVADIAEVFAKQKTGGTGMKGAVTATYPEEIPRPDGSTFTLNRDYLFDRPTEVPLYVNMNVTARTLGQAIDIDLIKTKVSERTYLIGGGADASSLYADAYSAGTNFILYDLEISDDNITFVATTIVSGFDSKFTIDTANITITEI
jgi:uncharacterized phage protein gp47/JayE